MGQELSRRVHQQNKLFDAVQNGELEAVQAIADRDPNLFKVITLRRRLSPLHVAAANGQIELLSIILERYGNPDILNRHKQTPLMFAAIHGRIACAEKLLQAGANILLFDSLHGRTCLHYAAYYGHADCLQLFLSAARSAPVAQSWGFARFVNVRDGSGATPLHLAARQRRLDCVHSLLSNGALVCASTGGYSNLGSTPLHLAARGGSLDCIRELLAWGADRLQRDFSGRIPYMVAVKYKHRACAALLNPLAPEPLTWPSSLNFIHELDPDTKALLEKSLIEANRKRETTILMNLSYSLEPQSNSRDLDKESEAGEAEVCCICFEHICSIEIQNCGHQMCAYCILHLCRNNKPCSNSTKIPACPFCRSTISQLIIAKSETDAKVETELELIPAVILKSGIQSGIGECSSDIGLSSLSSFGRLGRNSGIIAAECNQELDKLE